jgi:AAA15 family ATPase/GTPase
MKICSLQIENFRSIRFIDIKDLSNFVVIAGENGIGKSSIFEAIAFVKSSIAAYNYREENMWVQRRPSLISSGKNEMKVSFELEATTEDEEQIIGQHKVIAYVSCKHDGNPTGNWEISDTPTLRTIFGKWSPDTSKVGGFELIPANRTYNEGPLQLQYQDTSGEEFLMRRLSVMENKFHDAKQKFANLLLHDLVFKDEPKVFDEIKNLIEGLLGRKIKIQFVKQTMVPQILFETDGGFVDIDTLSSGERELFMTFVSLQSLSLSNSIILFDEPDLHLHATLQKKVMTFLNNMTKKGNQIIISTHSLEMISESSVQNLYHLSPYKGNSQLQNIENEKDKLDIFKKLGASKYTFLNFRKVVFLEGDSDYQILNKAANPSYGLHFEVISGVNMITPEILEEASQIDSFFMIRDRDFITDNEISTEESKYKGRIKFLKRRQIENYILDADALYPIIMKIGIHSYSTKEELTKGLFEISNELFKQTVVDYFLYENTRDIHPPRIKLNVAESAEQGLERIFDIRLERLSDSKDKINAQVSSIKKQLSTTWKDSWLRYCDGREVLRKFLRVNAPKKSFEDLRDMVSLSWDLTHSLPKDIEMIINEISQYNR